MKPLTLIGFLLAAPLVALAPVLGILYGQSYPDDPGKRRALAACSRQQPGFDRLLAAERAACYERQLGSVPSRGAAPTVSRAATVG